MRGHVGAVLTSGLAAVALALALLQAVVLSHRSHHTVMAEPAHSATQSNRYSAPGGRSGIPWGPFDTQRPESKPPEGRSPESKPPEEHHPLPPPRQRLPGFRPSAPRRAVA